jgi:hypothetical protein
MTHTPLAGERLQPLGHLSKILVSISMYSYLLALPPRPIVCVHVLHPFGAVVASLQRSNLLQADLSATRPPLQIY